MIIVNVEYSEIVKWINELEDINRRTPGAIAQGLNAFGQEVVEDVSYYVAAATGLGDNEVAMMIQVDWATPDNLSLTIDATEALAATQEADWSRPWDSRDQHQFEKETLWQIVTSGDEGVCPVCIAEAAKAPFSAEDIQNMQAKWADWDPPTPNLLPGEITNLVHPRCRCKAVPFQSIGSIPSPTTGQSRTPPDLFNTQNMASIVMNAYKLELKIK